MISVILLVAFIKLSVLYNNPLVLAALYTGVVGLLTAAMGVGLVPLLISSVLIFGLIWLFFWLLDRYEESGAWWVLVIVFPILLLFLSSVL